MTRAYYCKVLELRGKERRNKLTPKFIPNGVYGKDVLTHVILFLRKPLLYLSEKPLFSFD